MQFTVCLHDGRISKHEVKGKSVGDTRRKARKKVEELLATNGEKNAWKSSSMISDYITKDCIPAMKQKYKKERTATTYRLNLQHVADAMKGYTIANALRPPTLRAVLNEIAEQRGTSTAIQCRKALNGLVAKRLFLDGIIPHNPLNDGIEITVENRKTKKAEGGMSLTDKEWSRAVDWLLSLDPAEGVTPSRGRYTVEDRVAKRKTIIEATMLQSVTGLRMCEVRRIKKRNITRKEDATYVTVEDAQSKTGRGRIVPIFDDAVAERIEKRLEGLTDDDYVFASPVSGGLWDSSNADKAMNRFLRRDLAKACNIDALKETGEDELNPPGTHVWRATLNTIAKAQGKSSELCAAWLGHSEEVNRESYTDYNRLVEMSTTFKRVRADTTENTTESCDSQ